MNITFTGAILAVLPQAQGTSASGRPWIKQEYVIEDINQKDSSRICFEVFGEDKLRHFNIRQGELLTVSLRLNSSKSKDGRWFNQISCFRVVHHQSLSPQMQGGYQPQPMQQPQGGYQPQQQNPPF